MVCVPKMLEKQGWAQMRYELLVSDIYLQMACRESVKTYQVARHSKQVKRKKWRK